MKNYTSKFQIGDEAWCIIGKHALNYTVTKIDVTEFPDNVIIETYILHKFYFFHKDKLYATREEAEASLREE